MLIKIGQYYCQISDKLQYNKAVPKIFNYLKYKTLPRKAYLSLDRYSPQIGELHLTARCNLNCSYCYVAKMNVERNKLWRDYEATLEKVKQIIENPLYQKCILIGLFGGEPLLVDDLDRIVAYLSKHGYLTYTSTNGVLLGERINDLKNAGISIINVSLYDSNREVLERDLEKINKIFPVHVSIVLMRSMIETEPDKLFETIKFVKKSGCLSLKFPMYLPIGLTPQPNEIITETTESYLDFVKRVESEMPRFCIFPQIQNPIRIKKLCRQLWQRVGSDMSGNLIPCCGTEFTLEEFNNNIFTGSPEEVINHPTLVRMRKQLLDPISLPPDVCKTCNLLGATEF